jgi:hypothetical protein
MMRKAAALLLPLLAPAAVLADTPTETVIVDASTLTGVWKIAMPNQVTKNGFFGAIKFGALHDHFCRIGQQQEGLMVNCMQGAQGGSVAVEATHIHLAWGTMMARFVLDGPLQSSTYFQAASQAKLAGISLADPELSIGSKLSVAPDAPDKGGKAALLRTILADGLDHVPHDEAAIKKTAQGIRENPKLGAIQDIFYLGQQTLLGRPGADPDQVDYFSVYAVEFDSGERICGLHQRSDGVLDGFLCI